VSPRPFHLSKQRDTERSDRGRRKRSGTRLQKLDTDVHRDEKLAPVHVSQVLSYPRLADLHVGLLFDFNVDPSRPAAGRVIRRG